MITAKLFENDGVKHGFSTRNEGSTKDSAITDTDIKNVAENIKKITRSEFDDEKVALLYLVGGNDVVKINEIDGSMTILDADGAATDEQIILALTVADCLPILLSDKANGVSAVAHGGWKSLEGDIISKTVKAMKELGADPRTTKAVIGPSICVKCYEVGEEVAQKFSESVVDRSFEKPHIDLWKDAEDKLKSEGVVDIENLSVCTFENTDQFYSARKDGVTGRFLAYVAN